MALSDDILKLKDVFNGANPLQAGMNQAGGTLQLPNVQDIQAPQVAAPQPLMTPELAAQREAERGGPGIPNAPQPSFLGQVGQTARELFVAPMERLGQAAGEQKYGTGLSASGEAVGQPINPNTFAGQMATLPGTALNVAGLVTDPISTIPNLAGQATEYFTGSDIVSGGPVRAQPQVGQPSGVGSESVAPTPTPPPSSPTVESAQSQVAPPAAATPQIGGTITRGGETTFFQQGGGQIAAPSASQLSSFAEQQKGAEYNIVPELGADKPGFGPTTRANIAAGRPPNVSASEAASAQKQMAEQEAARTIDRAVAEYEQSLPNGGLGASAADRAEREEKVAQYRAGLTAQQLSKQSTGQAGLTPEQDLAERKFELDKAKFVNSVIAREGASAPLSTAQKKFAEEAGKGAYEWDQGGRAGAQENIQKFQTVLTDLEDGNLDTRTLTEFAPFVGDWARAAINPTGQQGLDTIRGVIFQGLRDTLGAQFTEREGERLVSASYNPKLDEASNIARLKPALDRMKATFAAKEALTQHIMQGGSVQDYKGITPMEAYQGKGQPQGSSAQSPIEGDVDVAGEADKILSGL